MLLTIVCSLCLLLLKGYYDFVILVAMAVCDLFNLYPICTEQIIQAVHEKVRRMSIGSNQSLNSTGPIGKFDFFFVSMETIVLCIHMLRYLDAF